MSQPAPTKLEGMLLDPAAAFVDPEKVLVNDELTREQKIRVLKLWEHDAAEAEVATEEGMSGGSEGQLRRILLALYRLAGDGAVMRTDPSKQHTLI